MVCYISAVHVKKMFGYDDALDAWGVHGVGGALGALLTGVFASNAINSGWRKGWLHDGNCGADDPPVQGRRRDLRLLRRS